MARAGSPLMPDENESPSTQDTALPTPHSVQWLVSTVKGIQFTVLSLSTLAHDIQAARDLRNKDKVRALQSNFRAHMAKLPSLTNAAIEFYRQNQEAADTEFVRLYGEGGLSHLSGGRYSNPTEMQAWIYKQFVPKSNCAGR